MTRQKATIHGMIVHFDVQSLSQAAEFIVEGRVTKQRVSIAEQQIGNAMRVIFTDHQVRVDNAVKLSSFAVGNIISVRTLGGETHDKSLKVDSEASLLADEEVVLFLSRDFPGELPPNTFTVLGGFQGKFSVVDKQGVRFVRRIDLPELVELQIFRRQIKEYLGKQSFSAGAT